MSNTTPFVAKINPLDWRYRMVLPNGTPTPAFQRQWQKLIDNANAQANKGIDIIAGVDIAKGLFVSINSKGQVILADATDDSKPAVGFVLDPFSAGSSATMQLPGEVNDGLSGLTPGKAVFLAHNGSVTQTIPTTGANQFLGYAISPTELVFLPGPDQKL